MAVMTSQQIEGVAFEQKTTPVPSSDKMALDLEINGTSNRDETILDASEFAVTKQATTLSDDVVNEDLAVNGNSNVDAFSSNQIVTATSFPLESQTTEPSPSSLLDSTALLESNTTMAEEVFPALVEAQASEPSTFLPAADLAIEAAVEDTTTTTTVPPVVEAPESDLRHATSFDASSEPAAQPVASPTLDLDDTPPLPTPQTSDEQPSTGPNENSMPRALSQEPVAETIIESSNATFDRPSATVLETSPAFESQEDAVKDMDQLGLHEADSEQVSSSNVANENDTEMVDAPQLSAKVSREREDDDETERAAKRTKTDELDTTMSEAPRTLQNGESTNGNTESQTITQHQVKEIIKVLKQVGRTKNGKSFAEPVARQWPTLAESYAEKVPHPIDLETIENKLNSGGYASMGAFQIDVNRLYDNAVLFNGEQHTVTASAAHVRDHILSKVANIPAEPTLPAKKAPKPKRATPSADVAPRARIPRRPSISHPPPPAQAPQTFALDPATNMPLIRRDSTKGDGGRPKRDIHPPKNKDLPYTVRPKNKKYQTELKFCEEVIIELQKHKYHSINQPFMIPVDPVALGIPNYYNVIKKPMDLQTVHKNLKAGEYSTALEFEKDVKQIFANCYKFNPPGNIVHAMGKDLEALFASQWAQKDQYLVDHSPSAASPDSEVESEEEEEEEDVAGSVPGTLEATKNRLLEEQTKLIDLYNAKPNVPAMIAMQNDVIDIIKKRLEHEEAMAKQKPAKKAKAPKTKKSGPAKSRVAKKAAAANKPARYLGTLEKETISLGLGALPETVMNGVVEMIKKERPEVGESDGTMELDIDSISVPLLWKIHGLVLQYVPEVETQLKEQMRSEQESPKQYAKPPQKKKNKPMSKHEQERKIQALSQKVEEFHRIGSGSQEPIIPTVETQESSGDESDSEEE